jgi:hypothetical protein
MVRPRLVQLNGGHFADVLALRGAGIGGACCRQWSVVWPSAGPTSGGQR